MRFLTKHIYTIAFVLLAIAFCSFPTILCKAFVDGLTVWAYNVLPVLFPFSLLAPFVAKSTTNKNKLTPLLFKIDADGIFFASLICGYPVGAKLISMARVDSQTATKLSSFCSTTGPLFLLVTVGNQLQNTTATAIVIVAQTLGCVLNGMLYRNKQCINTPTNAFETKDFSQLLTDSVLSMLIVGSCIALSFLVSAAVKSILPPQLSTNLAVNFALGLVEMTSGVFYVTANCADIIAATVLCSTLVSFGGLGIAAQSLSFLSKVGLKAKAYFATKLTQCAFTTTIAYALSKLLL